MRSRTLFLALATALVVVFAYLNWSEFTRATPLNLGWTTLTAPLGLILLGVLALAAIVFLASSAVNHSRHVRHEREQARALEAQRELAERAEASRFIDLRKTLETHLQETRQHDKTSAAELEQAQARSQRELRGLLEQMHRAMAMHLGEMEARLDARIDALTDLRTQGTGTARATPPVGEPARGAQAEAVATRNT
ncbi:MAG: hypothetical protein RIS88_2200 [Pseudomonadota bacterium]|jgi:uncharacterized integral membrane protein